MKKRKMQPADKTRKQCNRSSLLLRRAQYLAKRRLLRTGYASASHRWTEFAVRVVERFFRRRAGHGSAVIRYFLNPAIRGIIRNFLSFRPSYCLLLSVAFQVDPGGEKKQAVAGTPLRGVGQENAVAMARSRQGRAQASEIIEPQAHRAVAMRRTQTNR